MTRAGSDPESAGLVRLGAALQAACVSQPLRGHDGDVIGSGGLWWPAPREISPAEPEVLARRAEMTQSAPDRVRSAQREHHLAVQFSKQLLDLDRGSTAAAALYRPQMLSDTSDNYRSFATDQQNRQLFSTRTILRFNLASGAP